MAAFALDNRNDRVIGAINVTPLVDILLVLLIIFMIAAPAATQRLRLDLPVGSDSPSTEPANLSVKQTGELYWNGVAINRGQLATQFAALSQRADGPSLAIRAEPRTRYQYVADVLAAARNANVQRISVESDAR